MFRFGRKVVSAVLAVAFIISFSAPVFADSPSSITSVQFFIGQSAYFLNSQPLPINMDAAPYIDENSGRAMVPARCLADALGAQATWDAATRTVTVSKSVYSISTAIGSTAMTVNGQTQTMDQAPVIKDGRTFLPARWVANALGYQVDWNAYSRYIQDVLIWPDGMQEPPFGLESPRSSNDVASSIGNGTTTQPAT